MTNYLNCAETAKLLRQALKESFPGIKFGVRSKTYSGGASINVSWSDGPNPAQVEEVTGQFEGSYFDGMIDYKGSKYHTLNGEPISFGADYIFTGRKQNAAIIARMVKRVASDYGIELPAGDPAELFNRGELWNIGTAKFHDAHGFTREVRNLLDKYSDRLQRNASPTLNSLKFSGDDGYGHGTIGKDGKSGDQAYKGIEEARERAAVAQKIESLNAVLLSKAAPSTLQ